MEHLASKDRRASIRGRLGWRHLLPIVQTLLYCAPAWWGFRERYPSNVSAWEPPFECVLVQEGPVQWDPRYIDGLSPRGFTIVLALNLPPLVPAVLIALPASVLLKNLASFGSDLLAVASIGVFVRLALLDLTCQGKAISSGKPFPRAVDLLKTDTAFGHRHTYQVAASN